MNKCVKQNGFTLVELIIALLILSMVSVLCASAFRFGVRVWDTVSKETQKTDTIQAVHGFLQNSISRALLQDQTDADESQLESFFTGSTKRLKYISYAPKYSPNNYLYKYDIYFNRDDQSLELTYHPFNINRNIQGASKSTILKGIKDVKFAYFSGYEDRRGNQWALKWNEDYALPLLVKVNIAFHDNKITWPELVIQMRNGPYVIR